jgi:predicted transcriptional regulator of viral defense system
MYCWRYERRTNRNELVSLSRPDCRFVAWDLTEQIFKDIVVITGQTIRERHQKRQGFEFTVKHLKPEKIFGTKPVWRHKTKVPVSDVHRTVIDVLDDPALGGGIQHVSDCLNVYLKRPDRNDQ